MCIKDISRCLINLWKKKDVEIFAGGMEFKEFTAKSAKLEITENPNEVYIEIAEGKFHPGETYVRKSR